MRRRVIVTVLTLVASLVAAAPAGAVATSHVGGWGTCTSSDPPFPYAGSCATFNSRNTFYGTYGPGFPSPMGWGFCAFEAAHGGWYPAPGYNYALGTPPDGADTSQFGAWGWAMSEAQRLGWWDAGNGSAFSADAAAVAGKLIYDHVTWAAPYPAVSGTLQNALNALRALLTQGANVTATPTVSVSLSGGGTSIDDRGTANVSVTVPGSESPLANQSVTVTLTNAVADATGTATVTVATDASGTAAVSFTVPDGLPTSVTASATANVAVPGMLFYDPGMFPNDAQILAAAHNPTNVTAALTITARGALGTVQVQKTVDDPYYYPASGAVFEVLDASGTVVATLTTDATGLTPMSVHLLRGQYTLHEATPPAHYGAMADTTVTVAANANTLVTVGPANGDVIERASVALTKIDGPTGAPLAGAVFSLRFDTQHRGVADGPAITCRSDLRGSCQFENLLPGDYFLSEVTAPPHYVRAAIDQWVTLLPGGQLLLTVRNDPQMVTVAVKKFNAAVTTVAIPGATYDLYAVNPLPPGTFPPAPLDAPVYPSMTFAGRGVTDTHGQLFFRVRAGYQWCLHEVAAPAGYVVDPSLHCTADLVNQQRPQLAMPEHDSRVMLTMYKFAGGDPTAGVPNAYYALFVRGTFPSGFTPAPTPSNVAVPAGMTLWAISRSSATGHLVFSLPSGYRWCARELTAPPGYQLDLVLHCSAAAVTANAPFEVTHLAVNEVLAYTGGGLLPIDVGFVLLSLGIVLLVARRRRRHTFRS